MDNLISIIIPAYNAGNFIERCLKSLTSQTYKNLEIIVVNDGSTDNTQILVDDFTKKDPRIRAIHKTNSGVSDARNCGLEIATGDFIGFVDADDEVYPEMYDTLLSNIYKYEADISHCSFELVLPEKSKIFGGQGKIFVQNQKEAIKHLLKGDLFEPSTWSKLYKKEILKDVFFEKKIRFNEDLLFNAEAFAKAKKIVYQDFVLYRYYYNPSSASKSSSSYEIQQSIVPAAKIIKKKLDDLQIDKFVRQFYIGKLLTVFQALNLEGNRNTPLGIEIKNELSKTSVIGLDFRTAFLKYTLLYFPFVFKVSKKIYNRTLGKQKKWDLNI